MILALLLARLLACAAPSSPVAPPTAQRTPTTSLQPDLVLVLMAGLRADPPGGRSAEHRFVSALGAPPSRRFTAAYAQSVSPFVSAGSVLTGLYPSTIPMCGLHRELSGADDKTDLAWCTRIPEQRYTLPEVLGLYGYRTGLLASGFPGQELLAGEFASAALLPQRETATDWPTVGRRARSWWDEPDPRPRLLVLLAADLRLGQRPDVRARMGLGNTTVDRLTPLDPEAAEDPAEVQRVYEEVAGNTGRQLGQVLAGLAPRGSGMLTIVAGSNGLSLTEQGGRTGPPISTLGEDILLDRTLRVPLVLFSTGALEGSVDRAVPVELLDILPTLAAAAGAVPPAGLPGRDLRAPTEEDPEEALAYAEFGDMLALRSGPYLMAYRCLLHYGTSLDPEVTRRLVSPGKSGENRRMGVYNVLSDPLQEHPERDPDLLRRLHERMIHLRTGAAAVPADAMTPQRLFEIRMARSDGYW